MLGIVTDHKINWMSHLIIWPQEHVCILSWGSLPSFNHLQGTDQGGSEIPSSHHLNAVLTVKQHQLIQSRVIYCPMSGNGTIKFLFAEGQQICNYNIV